MMWRIFINRRTRRVFLQLLVLFLAFSLLLYMTIIFTSLFKDDSVHDGKASALKASSGYQILTNIAQYRYDRYKRRNADDRRPGAWGRPHRLNLQGAAKEREINLTKTEAFNFLVSEDVPLDRSLPDFRHSLCKSIKYDYDDLPVASVVLIFNNEAWTTLMRTAHSVVNRSPPELLKEVILVNDFSDRPELSDDKLDVYARKEWPDGVVKVVHLPERSGLVVARQRGAEAATGDVVVFLDAHCEASEGWLEPLLHRIRQKRTAVVCPMIGSVDAKDFSVSGGGTGGQIGTFWWSLHFNWKSAPQREVKRRKSVIDTWYSPTMAGGLLAVERDFFFETGGYDQGMDIWGGENLEMSFRTWMCGGSVEFVPCSQVPHVWRDFHPYSFRNGKDTHGLNSIRLAEAMMDDYKRFYYWNRDKLTAEMGGDISDRLALRKNIKCHDFKWYLDNVHPEKFIHDEHSQGWGWVRNVVNGNDICLNLLNRDESKPFKLGIYGCHNFHAMNQFFSFSLWNELRRDESCALLDSDAA